MVLYIYRLEKQANLLLRANYQTVDFNKVTPLNDDRMSRAISAAIYTRLTIKDFVKQILDHAQTC